VQTILSLLERRQIIQELKTYIALPSLYYKNEWESHFSSISFPIYTPHKKICKHENVDKKMIKKGTKKKTPETMQSLPIINI
jgi:hypothetical protein